MATFRATVRLDIIDSMGVVRHTYEHTVDYIGQDNQRFWLNDAIPPIDEAAKQVVSVFPEPPASSGYMRAKATFADRQY